MASFTTPRRRQRFLAALAVPVAIVSAIAFGTGTTQASDIANFTTVYGTDVVHAGFGGMRDDGTGSLTVSGVSGTVTRAYLYWQGPTNTTDLTANAAVTFAGSPVTGTNIGISSDNCWGYANSQAYRADVTLLVTGNGSFSLANFAKNSNSVNINGASLIVLFDDGNAANNRDVVLFDGNDSNINNPYDADGWNVSLPGINYTSGTANITMHVSDGQTFLDDALTLNATPLVAAGAVFQGDSVPSGPFNSNGQLWDIKTYDITSFLSPGPNTLTLTTGQNADCLSLVVAAIDLPAGAAPPPPLKSTSTTYGGGASVQYSDSVALSGTVLDTSGAPVGIAGKQLDFTLGTQTATASPTDASGAASTSLVVAQKPGTVSSVATAFAGDATYAASNDSDPFAINKEDCTVAYTGVTLVNAANMTNLSAQFGELDTSPGDWLGKSITFTATGLATGVQTFTATTNASGVAQTSAALGPDV